MASPRPLHDAKKTCWPPISVQAHYAARASEVDDREAVKRPEQKACQTSPTSETFSTFIPCKTCPTCYVGCVKKNTNSSSQDTAGREPARRPHIVTIALTEAQSNAIHKIRTEQFQVLIPFARVTAFLVEEALANRRNEK